MVAVTIIKLLGTSEESWEDAARQAVMEARETVEGGGIVEYGPIVEIAFPVHKERP